MPPNDLKAQVAKAMDEVVAPLLAMDGGRVEVVDVRDGIVQVRMHGTCASCPSTVYAVVMEVERELRQRVPEVEYLEVVP